MRKTGATILLLFICFPVILAAQNADNDPGYDWDYYDDGMFSRGDQTFIISLGTVFPTIFRNDGKSIDPKFSPRIGGSGSLAYNYYVTPQFFFGGEVSGMFLSTLGNNTLFVVPLGARTGYQFNVWRFEFPLSAALGMAWHRYIGNGYFGLYLKGGAAAFFRATTAWSFGIDSNWFWLPQWIKDDETGIDKTVYGNVLNLTLAARYHF